MSKDPVKTIVPKQSQTATPERNLNEQKQVTPKSAPKKAAKRKQTGDFWINLSVVLFISVCLLVLSFELLVKLAH